MVDRVKVFKSWRSYSSFERAVKHETRYIHSDEVSRFLQTVLETAEKRIASFPRGAILWRAQLGHDWRFENKEIGELPAPHKPERMCPRTERANEGRANPKGIPYLYLASNRKTAMAEVRPWVGSYVSVGQFKVVRDLKVVDCTSEKKGYTIYLREPSAKKREGAVWREIDEAFAEPINATDDVADYVATQVLSETFKSRGFDGLCYRSSLGDGYNAALFDIHAAEIINCFLYEVERIRFAFSEKSNPYFLKKHYKSKKPDKV